MANVNTPPQGQFILFQSADGQTQVDRDLLQVIKALEAKNKP